jgi:TolB protein
MNREPLGVRIRSAVLVAVPVAVALLLLAAPAHAAFPGNNGLIAFASGRSGNVDIYTVNPNGTGLTNVTNNPATDISPAWSPDGKKIAFVSTRDGAPPGPCDDGACGAIYVMNADGSGATALSPPGWNASHPAWSPDGSQIVFDGSQDGITFSLWLMNADGSNVHTLNAPKGSYRSISWAPDGQEIVYDWGDTLCDISCTTEFGISQIRPDGSGNAVVSYNPTQPDVSPDNTHIAVVHSSVGHDGAIETLDRNGNNPVTIRSGEADDGPAWSPNGQKIVFRSRFNMLYTMNADGTGAAPLLSDSALSQTSQISWQPIPINGYPRPKGATPFQTYLTVVYKPCASPNEQHGAPLAVLSCSPPQQPSDFLTVGTLDANGQAAKAIGSVRYDVKPGTAANPADDADVKINVSVKDVRMKSDLSDYAGELGVTSTRRITDKLSTPAPEGTTQAATTQDTPFSITVPCAPTAADTTVGSTCAISTTADAVVLGQVAENARSNWELGQIRVYDGGSDSDAHTTADNTLFMDEGIFVP